MRNDPPFCVFANEPFLIAAATHAESAGSGDFSTETSLTWPSPPTLTWTITMPLADDLSPHALALGFTLAIPAWIESRSSPGGRLPPPPPVGGGVLPPPLGVLLPPFLNFAQHAP